MSISQNLLQKYAELIVRTGANVQPGQVVSQGDQIARMGSTGTSSGPHLDFRIRVNGKFVNPMEYLGGVVA